MNILFIGPQGSGKGTQVEMLSKKLNIPYISTGNIFRENIVNETELGKMAKKFINEGELVPDEVTNNIVEDRLSKDDVKNGFIFDGYPRNLLQADFLDNVAKLDKVFEIYISDKESIRRLADRRSCKCGAVYHLKYNPPVKPGLCDKCGEKLFIREDDKEEKIKERLKIYHKETEKILNYYDKKGILITIDGEQPIAKVHADVMEKLEV
ncbi:MAG: adenylate kinase [bacterium]